MMAQLGGASGFVATGSKCDSQGRLNLIAAAEAHVLWKTRLGKHVQGLMREPLETAPLGQDGICQLGNWINGTVLKLLCEPDLLVQLGTVHQKFHQLGARVVAHLKAGDRKVAAALYDNEYSQSLDQLLQILAVINRYQQAI